MDVVITDRGYPEHHVDVWGWIPRVGTWGMIQVIPKDDAPDEDARELGTYITRPHGHSCGAFIPPNAPTRKNRQAKMAQQEVEDDPALAAKIEQLWRDRKK